MANGAEERTGVVAVAVAVEDDGSTMFTEEEVREMCGFKVGSDGHVEVTCGCTSYCYGDAVGTLRVFAIGDLEIGCDCTPGCQEDSVKNLKLPPIGFVSS